MNNNIKIILGLFLALSMILPVNVISPMFSTNDLDNNIQDSVYLMPVIESKTIKNDDCMYKVWVGGELHCTKIYYQISKDEGATWSDSKPITDESYTPVSVQLLKDKNALYIIWEDGTQRGFTTYHMKSNDDGATWSKPVNVGFKNPKMVLDNNIIYILSTTSDRKMGISKSADEGNTFIQTEPNVDFSSFTNDIMVNDGRMHLVFSGGIRDHETGTHSDTGIYYMFSKDGMDWDNAVKVSDVNAPVNSVSINNENDLLYVKWTEDREREHLTYMKNSLNGISWEKKEIVDVVEVPQQNHNPTVSSRTKTAEKVDKEWTFICYLDADNNLYNYGKEDMNEMEMIGSTADFNIVVLMDLNTNGDTKAYYVQQDADTATITSPEISLTNINASWGTELNMGNPQTCIDFVNYVYTNYPAKKYAMDFWNHGGSWKHGMCSDDTNSDDFTMLEVRTIFETLRVQTGRRILWDVCGYDECLMSDVSVAYDEKPYINYILNSEDSIGGDGWEYNIVLGHLNDSPTMDAETFAYWIYYSYGERYGTTGTLTTMSVINCTEFDYVLMPAINNLGQKLRHKANTLNTQITTAATNSASWQGYTHQRDLIDFAQNIQAQIPAATDQEIYDAAQLVIDLGAANTFGDVPWNSTWNHSKPILCHNQNTGENGVTIYCTETSYDTTYDTLRIASETSWDDAVKAIIANTADYPNEEPACSITSPSEGSYVVLNTIATITGNANDNADAGTVQKVEVKIDREAWQTATGTTSWSFNWDTTGWNPGPHKIFARAYDGTDYSEAWVCRNVNIIVDPTLPDLVITNQNITFSNPSPSEGEIITINATVWNINNNGSAQNASYVEVGFYVGNPLVGGELICVTGSTPQNITPNSCAYAEVTWDTSGLAGWHDIYVVADPNHTVAELTDGNNTAVKNIAVMGYAVGVSCPDSSSTIQAGASTTYEIVVTNKGTYTDSFELTIDNPTTWNANFNDNPPPGAKTIKLVNGYRNYTEITNELQSIATSNPAIAKLYSIGTSWEGRDIWAMKISDNVDVNETDEPDILYIGLHHAREWISDEVVLYYINYLVNNYGSTARVTYLVDNREIWLVPVLNPDGLEYSQYVADWRKNRRDNGGGIYGVDLNRNYNGSQNGDVNGEWGGAGTSHVTSDQTYCGPSPFSEPETQAIRDLIITHASTGNQFVASVSYHSYSECVMWPWGYSTSVQTPDDATLIDIGQYMASTIQNQAGTGYYDAYQSAAMYATTGDSDDWIYGYSSYVLGKTILPFTIELGTSFQPPESDIVPICQANLESQLYLTEIADNPEQEYPMITHTPLKDTNDTTGPYTVTATITSSIGLNTSSLKLIWNANGGIDTTMSLTPTGNPDEYYGDIPGQSDGTNVFYYIYAEDSGGNKSTSPETKAWESQQYNKFYVGEDRLTYTVYNLAPNATRSINLTVKSPSTALPEEVANIKVIVTSQNNSFKESSVTTTTTIIPGILLADDTNGGDITGFKSALDAGGYKYDTKIAEGSTGFSGVLSQYPIVIWVCKGTTTLSDVDKQNLKFYLLDGGNLFISGEDIGYDIRNDPDQFYQLYLHADYIADNSGINNLDGVTGDPIGDGFTNINITGSYPEEIAPYDENATVIFKYTGSTKNATIKVDADIYKVVYFACMYFEGSDAAANKDIIMDRIIKWFKPADDVGVQKINYPVNGNTYDVGEMTINAEVINYGSNPQTGFNVSCEVVEIIESESSTTLFSENFDSGSLPGDWAEDLSVVSTTLLSENFDQNGAVPTGWDISTWTGRQWEMTNDNSRYGSIVSGADYGAVCDSDIAGSGVSVDSWIKSPIIDCTAYSDITLEFYHKYNWYGETSTEGACVYLSIDGGSTWPYELMHYYTTDIEESKTIDISSYAAGKSNVRIGWKYVANYDYWWVVDDVVVSATGSVPTPSEAHWHVDNDSGRYGNIVSSGTDYGIVSDSDAAGNGNQYTANLTSPNIDCSDYNNVRLHFRHYHNIISGYGPDIARVLVDNGGGFNQVWERVEADGDSPVNELITIDISTYAAGQSNVKIRWCYIADWDKWLIIDDVIVNGISSTTEKCVYKNNQTISSTLNQYDTTLVSWDYNFKNTTDYRINIKTWLATDGAKGNDEKIVTIKITMSFTFSFKRGWNFITLPLNTTYERAGDIVNAVNYCTHIMRWNATAQCYETYDKNTGVSNFTIYQGIGYYIYLTDASDFTVYGSNITSQEVTLEQGWNSIGWINDTSTTASDLASEIENCTAVAYWNSTLGRYVTYTVGSNISDFKIERGMACFVYVTEASVWKNG